MGAVSNRKSVSAGISHEVQGRLPYFIDESQRALIRADTYFYGIKLPRSATQWQKHAVIELLYYNTWNAARK